MKKLFLLFIVFLSISPAIWAQQKLSESQIEHLALLGKSWSLLKYHHPSVAAGKYDWDSALVNIIPNIKSADEGNFNQILLQFIRSAGEPKELKELNKKKGEDDLAWLNQSSASEMVKKYLYSIKNSNKGNGNIFLSFDSLNLQLVFKEKVSKEPRFPDENTRLLMLFRFWGMIEYCYPQRENLAVAWADVIEKMLPKFVLCKNADDYQRCLLELVAKTDDAQIHHYNFDEDRLFGYYYLPFMTSFIENQTVVTGFISDSLANTYEVKKGDIVTNIGRTPIEDLRKQLKKFASNNALHSEFLPLQRTNRTYVEYSRGTTKTNITLENRDNQEASMAYLKQFGHRIPAENAGWKILPDNIGYISLQYLTADKIEQAMNELQNTTAILIDVRCNPNQIIHDLMPYFSENSKPFFSIQAVDLQHIGKFINYPDYKTFAAEKSDKNIYKGKVGILVNENTAALGAFSVFALKTIPNSKCIGSQTQNATVFPTYLPFAGDFAFTISFADVRSLAGKKFVSPDIEVVRTIQSVKEEKDLILEKAISWAK